MASRLLWFYHAVRYTLRKKIPFFARAPYCKRRMLGREEGSRELERLIRGSEPFMAGRMGLFETAVMRMAEFGIRRKYALTMENIYNCAGFFPNDPALAERFTETMRGAYRCCDIYACNQELMEPYFLNRYAPKDCIAVKDMGLYDVFRLDSHWSRALEGKRVLVVTSFPESVKKQYARREQIYPGSDILPEFASLQVYQSLVTIGDRKDPRFADWFEALAFMEKEILELDFDIALLACGAYGFPLAAGLKKAGKQAVCMGGVLQILFGILGRRWDGSRFGGIEHMPEKLKRYYNDSWIYPLEERPKEADGVEYGPYWK
ncbi:MAG: hypothetical protein K6E50_14700 [Lachnospiraceae bacterium]|nr:hypothetical protein [Lachnospiraceae bacterium]